MKNNKIVASQATIFDDYCVKILKIVVVAIN